MHFKGPCHCGAIHLHIEGDLVEAMECDCPICRMAGFLHWIVDETQVEVRARPGSLMTYRWGSCEARHYFCRFCGVAPLRRPRLAPARYSVNVRCLEGVHPESPPITPFPGRDLS
ncbi:GFA family protein [Halomonas ramblicola]|uniref:GFA family protein n=1 Tax=Halomonas ramblicola TaxID=747349 RepID=UPI0025B570F3|nr:hypothetical protein [Halomonas ramblicola]MDN3523030.1 hypothetical protein [Halomonas ramblicola]